MFANCTDNVVTVKLDSMELAFKLTAECNVLISSVGECVPLPSCVVCPSVSTCKHFCYTYQVIVRCCGLCKS